MATCRLCGKRLGIVFRPKVMREGLPFCRRCARAWPMEEKLRAMRDLFQDDEPDLLFAMPNVKYGGANNERITTVLLGYLLFTDRGVVFAQLGEYRRADPGWGAAFGLLGAVISSAGEKRREKEAQDAAQAAGESDLRSLLTVAPRVVFIPRGKITDIGWRKQRFVVRTAAAFRRFGLEKGKKTWKQCQTRVEQYLAGLPDEPPSAPAAAVETRNPYRLDGRPRRDG